MCFCLALWLILSSSLAVAGADNDRKFALESVGAIRVLDNVDGLFADYVGSAYKDSFALQSRFKFQDLSKADTVLSKSKIPYAKLIEDADILGQLCRALRIESLIRTRALKEGHTYRFTLEWLHAPRMDIMASETFTIDESTKDGNALSIPKLKETIQKALNAMIAKVPFFGHITGRDQNHVTVNIGTNAGIQKGDILNISTLEDVKRHPLLHAIVDWRSSPVGRLKVEDVEDGIAFCVIIDEEQGRRLSRYQKITQIISSDRMSAANVNSVNGAQPVEGTTTSTLPQSPRLGWVNGGLWLGNFSRQYSSLNGTIGKGGGGFFTGAKAEGQLWLTRTWAAELGVGYGFSGYSQRDLASGTATPSASVSNSAMHWRMAATYNHYLTSDLMGPKAWAKLGYRSTSYTLPASAAESTSPVTFKGLFLGIGGDVPIRDQIGARLALDVGILTSAKEPGDASGSIVSASDFSFFAGAYYRLANNMNLSIGLDVTANGADFADGATLIQKIVSFGPALVYYF